MISLAIDLSSGDLGAAAALEGVKAFRQKHPDVKLILVGRKQDVPDEEVVDAQDVVAMDAGPLDALRAKESSMYKAVDLVKKGEADGVVSAGGTGAYLSCATVSLRLIPGVKRSALVTPFPTKIKGKKVVILDCGASNENSGEEIAQFALMGSLYAQAVYNIDNPKVYLLSNGSEEHKGSPSGKEAYALLKGSENLNFCGNIEARDALSGVADVIATDGYSGNVLLKASEGTAKLMSGMLKDAFKRNFFSKIGYLLCKKGINEMKDTMDAKKVGGAMLLGVNGVVVKAHGNSNGEAFYNAIEVAYRLAEGHVKDKIKEGLSK